MYTPTHTPLSTLATVFHNLLLQGFAGFLAQRQLAGEAPPPEVCFVLKTLYCQPNPLQPNPAHKSPRIIFKATFQGQTTTTENTQASVLAEVPVPTDNSPADTDAAEPAKPTTARKRKPPAATGRGKGARRPKKQAYVDSEEDEDMEAADEDEEGMEYQQGGQRRGGKAVAKALAASGLVDELAVKRWGVGDCLQCTRS